MAALVLPMMVMMTGCSKDEDFFIKTWYSVPDPDMCNIVLTINKGGDCSLKSPDRDCENIYLYGTWTLMNENQIQASLKDITGYSKRFTFRKEGRRLLLVEDMIYFTTN